MLRNFNRLVHLARGEYFRWVGADDWLEPDYAACCVEALEANPQTIGVTTTHCDASISVEAYHIVPPPEQHRSKPGADVAICIGYQNSHR